jgi:hypothetical protein
MPTAQVVYINATAGSNSQSVGTIITSTKVRVTANVAVHYQVGNVSPVAYRANCDVIVPDTVRYINMEGLGMRIAFNPTNNVVGEVTVVNCGNIDITKVTNY